MIWIEIDDIELLRAFHQGRIHVIQEAILRNSRNKGVNTSFLTEDRKVLIEPTDDEIREIIRKAQRCIVYAFRSPTETFLGKEHPFLHLFTRNEHFPLKTVEVEYEMPKETIISDKLGFTIRKPHYGFESIAGNFKLKEYIRKNIHTTQAGLGERLKALMFFGTAGSGKTYAGEAIAYEYGYDFGYLDLAHFMTLPSPTRALDELFDFLQERDTPCVLLIDEIEKMFDFTGNDLKSKNVFGKLLTRLNDSYNDPNSKVFFIATANNIVPIVLNNPEFMRKGRFDDVFFLTYPDERSAKDIIGLFIRKMQVKTVDTITDLFVRIKKGAENTLQNTDSNIFQNLLAGLNEEELQELSDKLAISIDIEDIYHIIESVYPDRLKVSDDDEFIYSPPEIKSIVAQLQNEALYNMLEIIEKTDQENGGVDTDNIPSVNDLLSRDDFEMVKRVVAGIAPLQIYAAEGIKRQIAQAENYTQAGNIKHENYKKG